MKRNLTSIATLAAAVLSTLTIAPAGAQAVDSCPNAAIRAQQHAEFLPDCRAYELVSPTDKNGADVLDVLKLSDDGNAIAWTSTGAYADPTGFNVNDAYVARRGADGRWTTHPMYPAASDTNRPGVTRQSGGWAFSADLSSAAMISNASFDPVDDDKNFGIIDSNDVYRLRVGEAPVWVSKPVDGPPPNAPINAQILGVSADGSSIFFGTSEGLASDASGSRDLYRWRNDGPMELVSRDEHGAVLADGARLGGGGTVAGAGTGNAGGLPDSSAVSADGRAFVYASGTSPGSDGQLYLHRRDGSVALISASQAGATSGMPSANGAQFRAALPDFSAIYFASKDQLSDDAPVGGGDYRYDVESGMLSFSNPDDALLTGDRPVGMVRVSDDGRYVYFASTSDLAPGATAGEPNLYVKGPGGTRFVARLSNSDIAFTLSGGKTSPFTTSGLSADGTRLVFATAGRSTGYDNDGRRQVYVYDAVKDAVRCVSCNLNASKAGGSADVRLQAQEGFVLATPRVISADGRRIVFTSTEGLVSQDTNGVQDVYEDVDGRVSLVSSGTSARDSLLGGMSVDGSQIFIRTRSKLVSADVDNGLSDVYSVRVDGGFAEPAVSLACSEDACQGVPGRPTGAVAPGSASYAGAEEGASDSVRPVSSGRLSVARSVSIVGSAGQVKVTVPGAGRIALSGSGLRPVAVRAIEAKGYAVKVSLSARAARTLRTRHRVTVRVTVRFTPATGAVEKVSSVLTFRAKAVRAARAHRSSRQGVVSVSLKGR